MRDFQAQHRIEGTDREGRRLNLTESPLARLVLSDRTFLKPHQIEAAERMRRLIDRAQLRHSVTMNYSGTTTGGRGERHRAADLPDMAIDARRTLDEIHRRLPAECLDVVMDVCGWLKGLQEIERDRAWPRRSAKLVLRIGLEELARHFGLGPHAIGKSHVPQRHWRDVERPEMRL